MGRLSQLLQLERWPDFYEGRIDERVPPSDNPNYVPGILPAGGTTQIRFKSYARDRLPRIGPSRLFPVELAVASEEDNLLQ